MSKAATRTIASNKTRFEDDVASVVRRIRGTIADCLISTGTNATRPQILARSLGLDKSLSWKICRLLQDENPVTAVPLIPGKPGRSILVGALTKAGAEPRLIAAAQAAMHDFERIIELHAGDREKLEVMLGNVTSNGQRERAEAQRKLSFRGNSATWAVQAKVQVCSNFIAPGSDPAKADLAWLSGLIEFSRLRRDAVWAMAAARKTADDGTALPVGEIRAIDPRYDRDDAVPLMADFCSQPLPEIRLQRERDGTTRYELAEGHVGNTATTTCIVGLYGRNFVPRFRAPNDTRGEHFARLNTPVETLIHDLFVHRDLSYALSPQLLLYSQMPGGPLFPADHDRGRLSVYDPVIDLGRGPPDVVTSEFPRYAQMVAAVFERLAWRAEEFHGFRFRLHYPPIPTIAVWRYELA
ncbi:hypothetical protein RAS1_34180 [Phycisphaerae bacterium RAS1]|nr:hypothetical protein RAS1_34180 [Phycisphaerae bacterium RAS1]